MQTGGLTTSERRHEAEIRGLNPDAHFSVPLKSHRLRWRFEYVNGKATYGQWDGTAEHAGVTRRHRRDGLLWAVIEAEAISNSRLFRVAEVPGHEFIDFQWEAATPINFSLVKSDMQSSGQQRGFKVGLSILSTKEKHTALADGRLVTMPRKGA